MSMLFCPEFSSSKFFFHFTLAAKFFVRKTSTYNIQIKDYINYIYPESSNTENF